MTLITTNSDEVAAYLLSTAQTTATTAQKLVEKHGARLQTKVRALASGRPGPRAQTGDYRRSITLEVGRSGTGIVARVGTNRPQGARLEFGFTGADSLGRHYNQPPYPHFGPALDAISPGFLADVSLIIGGGRLRGAGGRFI